MSIVHCIGDRLRAVAQWGQRYFTSETKGPRTMSDHERRLYQVLFHHAIEQQGRVRDSGGRFVHYTNADTAMKIIKNREIWMRKSVLMNDFSEMRHGWTCLTAVLQDDLGKQFLGLLDRIFPGIESEIRAEVGKSQALLHGDTYITSISEHGSAAKDGYDEDRYGRLSMWRAYGGTTGVALVLNNRAILTETDALMAFTSPVAYLDHDGFRRHFNEMFDRLKPHEDLLQACGHDAVRWQVLSMLRFAVQCTKHPGFHEEREWRVIYSPSMWRSEFIKTEVEMIQGVPQMVAKIPLKNIPGRGLIDIEIPQLLDRLIIGPTQYPYVMWEAFLTLLESAGVEDAPHKICRSDIPLRH